jgi:urea carboxylase
VRSYLCLRGGLNVPDYLGKSTFTLGQFGGHAGRALRTGDVLHLTPFTAADGKAHLPRVAHQAYARARIAGDLRAARRAGIFYPGLCGDLFRDRVGSAFQPSRTGVRLIGPKPEWVRESGGEAGLHPSNIHDNPYAIGAVDFTGDMPVILGPDGPSLGGFVCPVTIIEADLHAVGQLKAGDKVRFVPVDITTARQLAQAQEAQINSLHPQDVVWQPAELASPIVLEQGHADKRLVAVG